MGDHAPIAIENVQFKQNAEGLWFGTIQTPVTPRAIIINLGNRTPDPTDLYTVGTVKALQTDRGVQQLLRTLETGPTICIDDSLEWDAWGTITETPDEVLFHLEYNQI